MRIRPDNAAALILKAGFACLGAGALGFLAAILGGENVQTPLYYPLSALSWLVALCVGAELLCLTWGAVMLASSRKPHAQRALLNVLAKSAYVVIILLALAWTKLLWVSPVEHVFFQPPVISPIVYVAGKPVTLGVAAGVGAGLLFYGGIALGWAAAAVLPLAKSAVQGPPKRSLREDLRRSKV
jgi:hypothetical protein